MPNTSRVETFASAFKGFVRDQPAFNFSTSAGAIEGTRRRHGAALVRAGVLFRGASRQWLVDSDRFAPALLFVLTRGRAGALPPKASRVEKAENTADA